jgi:hypothetical protein
LDLTLKMRAKGWWEKDFAWVEGESYKYESEKKS